MGILRREGDNLEKGRTLTATASSGDGEVQDTRSKEEAAIWGPCEGGCRKVLRASG